MAVMQSLPLALINLHILLSTQALMFVTNPLPPPSDPGYAQAQTDQTNTYILIASDVFAVYSIANTAANLFEHRGITNFTRKHHIDGSFAGHMCSILSFWYHLFHFVGRCLTLVVGAIEFGPEFAAAAFIALVLARAGIHYITRSERSWVFSIITIFVGTNAWDTLVAARLVHFLELFEGAVVVGILYADTTKISYPIFNSAELQQLNSLVPPRFLALIIMIDLGCATLLHFLFMEWTREVCFLCFGYVAVNASNMLCAQSLFSMTATA